jgi:hypothetical protein
MNMLRERYSCSSSTASVARMTDTNATMYPRLSSGIRRQAVMTRLGKTFRM